MCMPGDNVEMTIELIHPVAMEQGLTFAIREGGRTVGSGRVATSHRVIKYYSVNSRVSEISPEPFLHAIIMKMGVSGAKMVPKKTPSNFAIQRSFFLTIP